MSLNGLIIPNRIVMASASYLPTYSKYARVIDNETPFFSSTYSSYPLFYLPYTYYVEIIAEQQEFYHVYYNGYSSGVKLDGYVPKDKLFFDDLNVVSPYPNVKVNLLNSTTLFLDLSMSEPITHIFSDRTIMPYGYNYAKDGSYVFYISYGNELGYVKEKDVAPFTIENHPNPLTFLSPPKTDNPEVLDEPTQTSNYNSLKTFIIIALVFAGVIGLFIAFKGKTDKTQVTTGFYDENEYE